ncbi:MAG: hypothetical protein KDK78_06100 [Chlamydiia bacterium]|nr:hypothetical protein [Chlamydiia bacterium]
MTACPFLNRPTSSPEIFTEGTEHLWQLSPKATLVWRDSPTGEALHLRERSCEGLDPARVTVIRWQDKPSMPVVTEEQMEILRDCGYPSILPFSHPRDKARGTLLCADADIEAQFLRLPRRAEYPSNPIDDLRSLRLADDFGLHFSALNMHLDDEQAVDRSTRDFVKGEAYREMLEDFIPEADGLLHARSAKGKPVDTLELMMELNSRFAAKMLGIEAIPQTFSHAFNILLGPSIQLQRQAKCYLNGKAKDDVSLWERIQDWLANVVHLCRMLYRYKKTFQRDIKPALLAHATATLKNYDPSIPPLNLLEAYIHDGVVDALMASRDPMLMQAARTQCQELGISMEQKILSDLSLMALVAIIENMAITMTHALHYLAVDASGTLTPAHAIDKALKHLSSAGELRELRTDAELVLREGDAATIYPLKEGDAISFPTMLIRERSRQVETEQQGYLFGGIPGRHPAACPGRVGAHAYLRRMLTHIQDHYTLSAKSRPEDHVHLCIMTVRPWPAIEMTFTRKESAEST